MNSSALYHDSDMKRFVRATFLNHIRNHKKISGELKFSLERSAMAQQFISNISTQLEDVQILQKTRRRNPIKVKTLRSTVIDFTELLIKGVERQADIKRESVIAKYARKHAGDHVKDMESTLEGNTSGVYEDMGLEIARDEVLDVDPPKPGAIM